jgi:hypothetical protein
VGVSHGLIVGFAGARPRQTLTQDNKGRKTTPAMAARVTNRVWTNRDALLD